MAGDLVPLPTEQPPLWRRTVRWALIPALFLTAYGWMHHLTYVPPPLPEPGYRLGDLIVSGDCPNAKGWRSGMIVEASVSTVRPGLTMMVFAQDCADGRCYPPDETPTWYVTIDNVRPDLVKGGCKVEARTRGECPVTLRGDCQPR